MRGWSGPGSAASSSSLVRCHVDFRRQGTLFPSRCIGAASLSWSVSDSLLPSTDDLGFGTVLLLFWFLMFSLLCYWLVGGFGGHGYSNDYSWLRCCDGKVQIFNAVFLTHHFPCGSMLRWPLSINRGRIRHYHHPIDPLVSWTQLVSYLKRSY